MGHIAPHRAWGVLRKCEPSPGSAGGLILHPFGWTLSPAPITAGCLPTIGLALGIKSHIDDLLAVGKRRVEFAPYLLHETQ